jgi:hypothetical protein
MEQIQKHFVEEDKKQSGIITPQSAVDQRL